MYTVIRVTPADPSANLDDWVDAVNATSGLPPLKQMVNKRGFVVEVCRYSTWEAHVRALAPWLVELGRSLRTVEGQAVRTCVDVAVEPEDRRGILPSFDLEFAASLLADLSEAGIGLVVSVYPGDGATR